LAEVCDSVVIGAGVVGLAVARALARAGHEVLVLEREDSIGTETSSRNSEVIHAGIYYPSGSVKAQMCVRGKLLLYEHCDEYRVPYENIGKVIVATTEEQFDTLRGYQKQAETNGVGELRWMSKADIASIEPDVSCLAGVYSPTTGIIDSHSYMVSLQGDLEAHGGMVSFLTEVASIDVNDGIKIDCGGFELAPNILVNSAGLHAPRLAQQVAGGYQSYFAKGHYYVLSGKSPFNRLIYPVAEPGGLGVHVTLDLAHQAKFGPDVVWIDRLDYGFDTSSKDDFIKAIRRYYPALDESRLHPSYTGVRPKLAPAGAAAPDFVINGPRETGVSGLIDLLGIESPGLTASLAIAERVVQILDT